MTTTQLDPARTCSANSANVLAPVRLIVALGSRPWRSPPEIIGRPVSLANWITSRDNPLAARALANRVWALFFGHGFSRDLSDLGNQGPHQFETCPRRRPDVQAHSLAGQTAATYVRRSRHEVLS